MPGKTPRNPAKTTRKVPGKVTVERLDSPRARPPAKAATAAPRSRSTAGEASRRKEAGAAARPTLLAGGNPQIAKAEGDAPVQAYIAAMPGWKSEVGRRLDTLIARTVPGVRKAVKWNSPFYGIGDQGWFLSFHCFTRYVKVTFFRGTSLQPMPPGESRHREVRYVDIREDDAFDAVRFADWVQQASRLPGERM